MELVELSVEDRQKQQYIEMITEEPMELSLGAKRSGLGIAILRQWMKTDEDFNLAVTECMESALDHIEANLMQFARSDGTLALNVLKARRPEKWNPAHRIEVETVDHRYIDFTGEEPHAEEGIDEEGETYENDVPGIEDSSADI